MARDFLRNGEHSALVRVTKYILWLGKVKKVGTLERRSDTYILFLNKSSDLEKVEKLLLGR